MAKNVIITEDGHSKTISNATRIRTALEGGGTCDWIPKDDVPLQELTVTEDGVYNPDEGYYGFSQVTANGVGTVVEGTLIEKTITKNGTYNITDESGNPYGYSKITVNVDMSDDDSGSGSGGGGSTPVVGKDEDGNDTMAEADDDGNIVMTVLPTEIKVIIPPTKLEYNRHEEIDYSGISVYAYISKAVHWLGTTTTAVTEGSSDNTVSIGEKSVTVSVGDGVLYAPDRTGANDVQLVWDGSKWVKPANYSAEKAIWKSDKYESGKIPFGELIFPVKRASEDKSGMDSVLVKSGFAGGKFISIETIGSFKASASIMLVQETIDGGEHTATKILENPIKFSIGGNYELTSSDAIICAFYGGTRNTYSSYVIPSLINSNNLYYKYYNVIFASENEMCHITETGTSFRLYYDEYYGRLTYENDSYIDNYNFGPYIASVYASNTVRSTDLKLNKKATIAGKTVYYVIWPVTTVFLDPDKTFKFTPFGNYGLNDGRAYATDFVDSTNAQNKLGYSESDIAWISVYGQNTKKTQAITLPVQWKRPGDGKILETTFTAWMTDDMDNNTSGSTTPGSQNIDVPQ